MMNAAIFFFIDHAIRGRISRRILVVFGIGGFLAIAIVYSGVNSYEDNLAQRSLTTEDAIQFVTQTPGTYTFYFPHYVGTKHEVIDGYDVWKTTGVQTKSSGDYIVIFAERWKKGKVSGQRRTCYEVVRDQYGTRVGANGGDGDTPPFNE
jgi:hypothetical protein